MARCGFITNARSKSTRRLRRSIDGIDQTSFLLADDGESNREKVFKWSENDLMAMRMYEYKIHVKVIETPLNGWEST